MRQGVGTLAGVAAVISMATLTGGCGGGKGTDPAFAAGEEARRVVLTAIADDVIVPAYARFVARAEALVMAIDGLEADPLETTARATARAAWASAMDAWQEVEVFQIGPAGATTATPGGAGLRDRIYSWPLTNPCRVDQETLSGAHTDATALASAPANVRGLDALEYLLFVSTSENACPINAQINTSGAWNAGDEAGIASKRAAHAASLARDLAASAKALETAWSPTGGDFRGELAAAGQRSVYATAQEALNSLSDAIFYLDTEVKDAKVGTPLGYFDCSTDICPEAFESRRSARSKANLESNVRAFRRIFSGADTTAEAVATPRHFQALLVAAGQGALAGQMLDAIDRIDASLAAVTTDLESAIQNDLVSVEAIYGAIKGLTDLMKTQFISTLDLELPKRAEGDND